PCSHYRTATFNTGSIWESSAASGPGVAAAALASGMRQHGLQNSHEQVARAGSDDYPANPRRKGPDMAVTTDKSSSLDVVSLVALVGINHIVLSLLLERMVTSMGS